VLGLVFHPSRARGHPALPADRGGGRAPTRCSADLRAYLERIFDSKVFVVSFVFNVLVAALIVYVGDQLGVGTQLSIAIIVVLGIRIFGNCGRLAAQIVRRMSARRRARVRIAARLRSMGRTASSRPKRGPERARVEA